MASGAAVRVDLSDFQKALREYTTFSRLSVSEAINKKAGDVAFKGASLMPKARAFYEEFPKGHKLWHALATGKTKLGATKKGVAVRGKGNKKIADNIFASRKRHMTYSRALFLVLAGQLGKKVSKLRKSSKIQNAKGRRAKESGKFDKPEAVLEILGVEDSHAPLLEKALRESIAYNITDMKKYIERKIAERARDHSGRGKR